MSENVIYVVTITLLIALAGLGFWIARQSLGLGSMSLFQSKPKRTGLVEATMLDGRRRLLLVRRDNVEHLILIGGPVDVVIETGIRPEETAQQAFADGFNRADPALPTGDAAYPDDIPLILHRDQTN